MNQECLPWRERWNFHTPMAVSNKLTNTMKGNNLWICVCETDEQCRETKKWKLLILPNRQCRWWCCDCCEEKNDIRDVGSTSGYQWVAVGTSVPGVPRGPRPNQRCYLHLWCRFSSNNYSINCSEISAGQNISNQTYLTFTFLNKSETVLSLKEFHLLMLLIWINNF